MFTELSDNQLYFIISFLDCYCKLYYNFNDLKSALYYELIDRGVVDEA